MKSFDDKQRDLFLHYVRASVFNHLETNFLSKALQCLNFNSSFYDHRIYRGKKKQFISTSDENDYSELLQD